TVWRCSSKNCYFTGRLDTNRCALPSTRGHRLRRTKRANLNISRNADADQPSLLARTLLLLAKVFVVGHLERFLQSPFVVAAVIKQSRCSLEWKLIGSGKVLTSHIDRVHSKLGRHQVNRALDDVGCFGTASPSISVGRHFVGEDP